MWGVLARRRDKKPKPAQVKRTGEYLALDKKFNLRPKKPLENERRPKNEEQQQEGKNRKVNT